MISGFILKHYFPEIGDVCTHATFRVSREEQEK